jgi:hypothetical protein
MANITPFYWDSVVACDEGVKIMTEEKQEASKEETKKGKKKADEPLPFCTTAPSAEHARGPNEDEPCDDSREAK